MTSTITYNAASGTITGLPAVLIILVIIFLIVIGVVAIVRYLSRKAKDKL